MKLESCLTRIAALVLCQLALTACSYNPFISNNHTTGSLAGTAVGAGVGAGAVALIGGTRPYIALGGLTGGAIGYYLTTLRADSGDIIQAGGNVYVLGEYIGIYLPSDHLFEPNTADFLPQAPTTLNSVVTVLNRKPDNNIIISGNTSGFSSYRREQVLSQLRAKAIAAYLWTSGISQFKEESTSVRKLNYVGYGDFFPIASDLTNTGIRTNSRIQITSYPSGAMLRDKGHKISEVNIASMDDRTPSGENNDACGRDNVAC